jgi:hypothetical protein
MLAQDVTATRNKSQEKRTISIFRPVLSWKTFLILQDSLNETIIQILFAIIIKIASFHPTLGWELSNLSEQPQRDCYLDPPCNKY